MRLKCWRRVAFGLPPAAMVAASLAVGLAISPTQAAVTVSTQHNDNNRSGDNLAETALTPVNVNQTQFGKLFSYAVDDQVYTQPLVVPGVTMSVDGQAHNVVYIATVNDSVYAFDADSNTANGGNPLWHVSLAPTGSTVPSNATMAAMGACGGSYNDFTGKLGIVGTPVISTSTNTMYVVAKTVEGGNQVQRLHALNITSGAEMAGSPVVIAATAAGVSFNPTLNNQRAALTLSGGTVYVTWSSYCDYGAYRGWIIGFNPSTLAVTSAWPTTANGGTQAGIWQGGQGLTADGSGNLYLMTGNGTWDGTANFGESAVKLSSTLGVLDYFTPSNWSNLNGGDTDLGSAGVLGIPGTTLVFGGGKQGKVYLMNTANMGHEATTDNVVQSFQATFPTAGASGHIHGGPVYYNAGAAQYVYLWGENDILRAFQFNGTTFNSTAIGTGAVKAPASGTGMPGGFMSLSANGTSNGIIWASTPYNGDANHGTVQGILRAYNAVPSGAVLSELWNSKQNTARDDFGNFAKFSYPTVANGKVYVPTFGTAASASGGLAVYGVLPVNNPPPAPSTLSTSAGSTQLTLTWSASSGATSYNVYRGGAAGGEGGTPIVTGITGTTYTNTGLTNGTTYYYKVAAVNANGTSGFSPEANGTPTGSTGSGGVSIDCGGAASGTFVADTDFAGGSPTSFAAAVDTSLLTGTIPAQTVLQTNRYGTCTYTIPGLTAGAAYPVTLYFSEGYWTAAGKRTFTVVANGTTELTNFDIYAAAGAANKAVQRSFNINANASGQIVLNFNTVVDNAQVNGIVVGSSGGGTAPGAPTGVGASAGNAQVSVTWSPASGATSYNLYRGASAGGEGATPYKTNVTSPSVDTGLTNGTTYYYKVSAVNASGTSALSSEVSATPSAGTAPGAPTGVTAAAGNSQVSVSWTGVSGATSYNLYRGLTAGGEGVTAYKTNVTSPSVDTGLTNGTAYFYRVSAVNAAGTSALSLEVSGTPTGGTGTTLSIDAGGAAANPYVADVDFSGGGANTWTNAVNTSLLTGTIPPATVLQSDREGNFTYTIPGYTAGSSHTVTLYFVEQYWNAAGKRVFTVTANGTAVLTNFDVWSAAGAQFKAVQRSFTMTANASGQLVLQFTASVDQSKVSAIVVN